MTLFHNNRSMRFVDIHTHNSDSDRLSSIFNSNEYIVDRIISMGIHPWEINDRWKEHFATIGKISLKSFFKHLACLYIVTDYKKRQSLKVAVLVLGLHNRSLELLIYIVDIVSRVKLNLDAGV